jgi:hypothetical protein
LGAVADALTTIGIREPGRVVIHAPKWEAGASLLAPGNNYIAEAFRRCSIADRDESGKPA